MHTQWHKGALVSLGVVAGATVCAIAATVWLPNLTTLTFSSELYTASTTTLTDKPPATSTSTSTPPPPPWPAPLDTQAYNTRLLALDGFPASRLAETVTTYNATTGTTTKPKHQLITSSSTNTTVAGYRWPVENPYPHGGALLPFHRIVAYYGNFYSTRMGILGEFPTSTVVAHLASTSAAWAAADPDTPVLPAIHYIAMVAQADAGADGMYRAVMPDREIEKAHQLAKDIDGVLFLDLQVGLSTVEQELPKFRDYLSRPDVHLGIDPEFSMKTGDRPGTVIGTFDAADINYTINWLADIVNEHQLPPKVLVVHRFTQNMITNYQDIKPRPEVQVVIDMDGWGSKQLKRNTYHHVIVPEPVQFTGMKLFYKNDLKPPSTGLYTPTEVLKFTPKPIYIQYQ